MGYDTQVTSKVYWPLVFFSDWIKIHFDENDEIMYFHFIPNANNNGLQIINLTRRQETRSTAYVGLLIYKCKLK